MNAGQWRDPKTNMIWMRCSLGQMWDGTTCAGEAKEYTWEQAQQAAKDLNTAGGYGGYRDWMVPHIEDLSSLIYCSTGKFQYTHQIPTKIGGTRVIDNWCKGTDYQQPTIETYEFPNTTIGDYWTSSPFFDAGKDAWFVDFYYGGTNASRRDDNGYVRLVRPGQ